MSAPVLLAASGRTVIAPVVLGCCPDSPRCVLCEPPPPEPAPDVVSAVVALYEHRAAPADELVVGFYGGPPPTDAMVDAIDGRPFRIRVRPDLLSRARFEALVARGCAGLELDALTFDDLALRACGRRYRTARVLEMLHAARRAGVRVGVVLAPGLPGADAATARRDAEIAAGRVDTVRLHPVLVLARSALRERHAEGAYTPLTLPQAVGICRELMDALEAAGVEVIRVGSQPGHDGLGRAIAGPRHGSLRELVEADRALERLRRGLDGTPRGAHIVIRCARADEARVRGPLNGHIRSLRAEFGLSELRVAADPEIPRGRWQVERESE